DTPAARHAQSSAHQAAPAVGRRSGVGVRPMTDKGITMRARILTIAISTACLGLAFAPMVGAQDARAVAVNGVVAFDTVLDAPAMQLRVTGPGAFLREVLFVKGEPLSLPVSADAWPDGQYRFEIWPINGVATRKGASFPPAGGESGSVTGAFRVASGSIIVPEGHSETDDADGGATRDQVVADDLIVQSSLCVGFDCVNNENFGFDTIRLKENNTRIKFEDTSTGTYPSNDWQLTANDSTSGGLNRFS